MVMSSQVFKTPRLQISQHFQIPAPGIDPSPCAALFPCIWSEFSLLQLVGCLLSYHFARLRRVWLHLYNPSCRQLKTAVRAHFSFCYWEWASQFPQPPLMLCTPVPECFGNPLLDSVQFFVLWDPKLDTVLQMWPHKYWIEWVNHFSWLGGYCLAITVQHGVGFLTQGQQQRSPGLLWHSCFLFSCFSVEFYS